MTALARIAIAFACFATSFAVGGDEVDTLPVPAAATIGMPDDPLLGEQWALQVLEVYRSDDTATLAPVVVAVIDTGLDFLHPDLAPANQWRNGRESENGADDDGNGYIDDVIGWN